MNKGELSEVFTKIAILLGQEIYTVNKFLKREDGHSIRFSNLELFDDASKRVLLECGKPEYELVAGSLDPSDYVTREELQQAKLEVADVLTGKDAAISKRSTEILQRLNVKPTNSAYTADLTGSLNTMDGLRELGFSVKSFFAANPTLFNATKHGSRFRFEISREDGQIDMEELVRDFNGLKNFQSKFEYLKNLGLKANSIGATSATFKNSLNLFGENFDVALGELLVTAFAQKDRSTKLALEKNLTPGGGVIQLLEIQLRNLLKAVALGLTASKNWNGKADVYGGYLIVFQDLSIANLGAQNLDEFSDYLLENTYFEAASTKRHDYGYLFVLQGKCYLDLQLQVRFSPQKS